MNSKCLLYIVLVFYTCMLFLFFTLKEEISDLKKEKISLEKDLNLLLFRSQRSLSSSFDQNKEHGGNDIILYNRVPKTGSTSFIGLAYDLCLKNKIHVIHVNVTKNTPRLSLSDQVRFVQNITTWDDKKPAIYHGHLAYLDFDRFGASADQRPIYINIIRKPLDRLVSYYYFLRFGDDFRPHLKRRKMGDSLTFDECVQQKGSDCDSENLWLQVPFFCGHAAECWNAGSLWALEQAKFNLVNKYFLVGVSEQMEDFINLLEYSLPRFFRGATQLYASGKKSHLRKTYNKKDPSEETVKTIQQSPVWKIEEQFYNFALEYFHFVKKHSIEMKNDVLTEKRNQFLFEKIRPS